MKIHSRLILLGACLVVPFAAAAPDETPQAEHWVSPDAQKIIDRINAAYAGVDGWTATNLTTTRDVEDNTASAGMVRSVERYLRNDGSTSCYSATNYFQDELAQMMMQYPGEMCLLSRGGPGKCRAMLSTPLGRVRMQVWATFLLYQKDSNYVRSWGRESFAEQDCDLLELTQVASASSAAGEAKSAPVVTTVRCWVAPSGFIVRLVRSSNSMDGVSSSWSDLRITFDPHAKLDAADFSQEAFVREATAALKGEPMPELVTGLIGPGGSLPDLNFTAWEDKKPFRLSDLRGKVVVIETWATWCHACKEAFPSYEKMRQTLAQQDVVFVAVSFDAKTADYEKWMNAHGKEYGFKFGHVDAADPMQAMREFKGSTPAFYVLGRDGKIVGSYSGFSYEPGQDDPRLLKALRAAGIKL